MLKQVPQASIDYDEVLRRGGRNCGNEEFAAPRCPFCGLVYLMDAEVETVYFDASDLSKRKLVAGETFDCTSCGRTLPEDEVWIGPKSDARYRVSPADLTASVWAWAAKS